MKCVLRQGAGNIAWVCVCDEGHGLRVACASTPVGETSERMRRYGVGKFVPVNRCDEWKVAIEEILDKGMPPVLDRAVAREAYDWSHAARRFVGVYRDLYEEYFGHSYA